MELHPEAHTCLTKIEAAIRPLGDRPWDHSTIGPLVARTRQLLLRAIAGPRQVAAPAAETKWVRLDAAVVDADPDLPLEVRLAAAACRWATYAVAFAYDGDLAALDVAVREVDGKAAAALSAPRTGVPA